MKLQEILSAAITVSLALLCLAGALLLGELALTARESREQSRPKLAPACPACPCCPMPQEVEPDPDAIIL